MFFSVDRLPLPVYAPPMRKILSLAALCLTACGEVEPLTPAAGDGVPIAPAQSARAPTTEEMLTPPPVTRPVRQEDTLRRSEEREDDPFDLPPTD